MVQGMRRFKETFSTYKGQYVFIGGTACDIILGKEGVDFRQTKDLDIVLIIEALDDEFVRTFIDFVQEGGYEHINKGTGGNQFYRFEKPANSQYPYMIELFSRRPDYLKTLDAVLSPIHINNEVVSLSVILLNDEYYSLLRQGTIEIDGVSVLDLEYLVLFKMRAFIDLKERKEKGEKVDSKSIRKHKNDIIRLVVNMRPNSKVHIEGEVFRDAVQFLKEMEYEDIDLKSLGIRGVNQKEVLERIKECYNLE